MPKSLANLPSLSSPRVFPRAAPAVTQPTDSRGWLARWIHERRREGSSWLASLAMHLSLLALLGTIIFRHESHDGFFGTVLTRGDIGSADGAIDGSVIASELLPLPAGDQHGAVGANVDAARNP